MPRSTRELAENSELTYDDRREPWTQNGKLSVGRKRSLLRLEMARHGIFNYSSDRIPQKLGDANLDTLRRLHAHAVGGDVGAMGLRLEQSPVTDTLQDVRDSAQAARLEAGSSYLDLDFRPFNSNSKGESYATEATFFLLFDLRRVLVMAKHAQAYEHATLPELVHGSTNPTLGRLAMKHLGMHPYGARVKFDGYTYEFGGQKVQDILAGSEQETLTAAQAEVDIHFFASGNEFFSDRAQAYYTSKADFLQSRISQPDEDPINTERRLRILAIRKSLEVMAPDDVLRLSRHGERQDGYEWPGTGPPDQIEARRAIVEWEPVRDATAFVPPDYYMK